MRDNYDALKTEGRNPNTMNIDKVGGEGTAVFACEAIKAMVGKK